MPTVFEGTLDFPNVIQGTDLLLIGRFSEVVDEESDLLEDETERLITTARFRVEEVVKGSRSVDSVDVRLVPALAKLVADKGSNQRMILALSPDPTLTRRGERFVPYFSSVLPLDDDNRITLALGQDISRLPGSLDEVRGLVSELQKEVEQDVRLGYEAGEDEIGKEKLRDVEVGEMPPAILRDASRGESDDLEQTEVDGSRPSAPDGKSSLD